MKGRKILNPYFQEKGIEVDTDGLSITFPVPEGASQDSIIIPVARIARGLTQRELANQSGVSLKTIIKIEKGRARPTDPTIEQIADALRSEGVMVEFQGGHPGRWKVTVTDADEAEDFNGILERETDDYPTPPDPDTLKPGMRRLKISFDEVSPPIWREIALPENTTFADIHAAIQIAFGWNDKSPHEFRCGIRIGNTRPYDEDPDLDIDVVDERLVRLRYIFGDTDSFTYCYGKDEHWVAEIEMKSVSDPYSSHPVVVGGQGASAPEEAWAGQWSRIAKKLRAGRLDEDGKDWLHFLGFPRDYDPDLFDIDAINYAMAAAGFSFEADRQKEHARRNTLRALVDKIIPDVYPRAPKAQTSAKGPISIEKVERLTKRDVVFDRDDGMATMRSLKGGDVNVRPGHSDLVGFLDRCGDVTSFESFPCVIYWKAGAGSGRFQPDFEVTYDTGTVTLLHVAYDDAEVGFVKTVAAAAGVDIAVVRNDVLADTMVVNSVLSHRYVQIGEPDGLDVFTPILGTMMLSSPMPMANALIRLSRAGFGRSRHGLAFGTTEERVAARVLAAVENGVLGMDFRRPFAQTVLGSPELTSMSCQLHRLLAEWARN
ncbi:helix-turn-helix domain-containing protein [Agrobacterium rubi]|nr:helix-turn-helix domain-containing protein [Agrobacterium rubi]NTF24104.1 helix-turn-helix domain-containing protein [Agrobacterium rubi]